MLPSDARERARERLGSVPPVPVTVRDANLRHGQDHPIAAATAALPIFALMAVVINCSVKGSYAKQMRGIVFINYKRYAHNVPVVLRTLVCLIPVQLNRTVVCLIQQRALSAHGIYS